MSDAAITAATQPSQPSSRGLAEEPLQVPPQVPQWMDTHCHLQLLDDEAAAVATAAQDGVGLLLCVGIDAKTTEAALVAAHTFPGVWASSGLHPHSASDLAHEWELLSALAADPLVVAIGETGFDFYRDHSPPGVQEEAFRQQIAFAKAQDKTLIIHSRDAWADTFRVLADAGPPERFVFHCFSGGPDEARRAVEMGACLSFAGPLTYPKNETLREAARTAPHDRIVVETDAPFLPPQGFRGKTCFPAYTAKTGSVLADVLGLSRAETAALTTANACRVFRLPELSEVGDGGTV